MRRNICSFSKIYVNFFWKKTKYSVLCIHDIYIYLWNWLSWPMFWQEAMAFRLWMKHHLTKWNHPEYDEQKDHSCGKCQISNENFSKLQQIRITISFKPVSSYTILYNICLLPQATDLLRRLYKLFFRMDPVDDIFTCMPKGVHSIDGFWVNYSDVRSHQPK